MTFDDLASLLSDHLDAAIALHADRALKVLPTCIAPRKRSWEVRDGRRCVVSVTLSEAEGLHLRMKHGSDWLHTITLGSKPPEPVLREAGGVVMAMLRRERQKQGEAV